MSEQPDFRELTRTLYRAVSAAPGQRDWAAVRRCYHPQARLVRTGLDADGKPFTRVMALDAYIENVEELLKDARFTEREIGHEAVIFGNVARLTSLYEFTWDSPTEQRRGRGVNFFTLVREEGRWLVMSIVWDTERPGNALPQVA
jgi:Domain of unknown function (DUF4440)